MWGRARQPVARGNGPALTAPPPPQPPRHRFHPSLQALHSPAGAEALLQLTLYDAELTRDEAEQWLEVMQRMQRETGALNTQPCALPYHNSGSVTKLLTRAQTNKKV